jgi:hypothetical protein
VSPGASAEHSRAQRHENQPFHRFVPCCPRVTASPKVVGLAG